MKNGLRIIVFIIFSSVLIACSTSSELLMQFSAWNMIEPSTQVIATSTDVPSGFQGDGVRYRIYSLDDSLMQYITNAKEQNEYYSEEIFDVLLTSTLLNDISQHMSNSNLYEHLEFEIPCNLTLFERDNDKLLIIEDKIAGIAVFVFINA